MEKLVLWGKDQVGKEDFRGNLNYKRLALCNHWLAAWGKYVKMKLMKQKRIT